MKIDEKWKPLQQAEDFIQQHTKFVSDVYSYEQINELFNDNSLYTAYFKNDNFIRNTVINSAYLPEQQKIHIVNTEYDQQHAYSDIVYTCRFTYNSNGPLNKYLSEFEYNRRAEGFNFAINYEEFEDTHCTPVVIVFNSDTRLYSTVSGITNIINLDKTKNYVVSISLQTTEKRINGNYANYSSFALGYKDDNYFLAAGFRYPEIRLNPVTHEVFEIANPNTNFSYHLKNEGILVDPNLNYGEVTKIDDTYIVRLKADENTDAIHLLLTIDDTIKYLAYCNVCFMDVTSPGIKYVSECVDNVLTGNLLAYDVWRTSNNTNNNSYEDTPTPVIQDERDNVENMNLSYLLVQNTAPFSRYYICTQQQLTSLAINISDASTIPEGLNIFDNIVFLQCYPVDLLDRFLTNNSNIIIANWDSSVSALRTTSQITVSPAYYIDIDRHYNDYRDFAPVSKYELYLPLSGMYQLPDFCAGCRVKIQILYDIISCELIYHISVSDRQKDNYTLIDKVKCVCGTSISFKSENNSMKLLENRQNILNTINSTTAFISSLATKNVAGTISATTNFANSFTNDAIINNKSRTQVIGQNTSVASFNDVSAIYLYITRTETKIPADFPKTTGFLYDNEDILKNHSGSCICDNVDINNLECTFEEKQILKNLLENYFDI